MVATRSSSRSQEGKDYRKEQKEKLGADVFKKKERDRKRIARGKAPNKVENKTGNLQRSEEELKKIVTLINSYLLKEVNITLPEVSADVKERIMPALVDLENAKGCEAVKLAIYQGRKKYNQNNKFGTFTEKSMKTHWDNVMRTYKRVHNVKTFDCKTMEWMQDAEKIIAFIKEQFKNSKTKNSEIQNISSFAMMTSVLKGYEEAHKIYSGDSSSKRKQQTEIDDKSELTEKEKNLVISKTALDNAHKAKGLTNREKALIAIYSRQPSRRAEFGQYLTYIREGVKMDHDKNYLVLSKKGEPIKFVLRKYKTFKRYGEKTLLITDRVLKDVLINYLEEFKKPVLRAKQVMFPTAQGKYYQNFSSEISKVFKKATKKSITVNILRHIWISNLLKGNPSLAQKKALADKMGHSIDLQSKYNRIDIDDVDDISDED